MGFGAPLEQIAAYPPVPKTFGSSTAELTEAVTA